jgi:hypothetical protein
MANCPQCQASLDIQETHYGTLFNCPQCQAVFFVGWDGVPEQPQMQGGVEPVGIPPIEMPNPSPVAEATPLQAVPPEAPADLSSAGGGSYQPEMSSTPHDFGQQVEPAIQADPSPDFQDVVEFGNNPELKSNLTYTVAIQGIEIADTREKFKEAIADSRFGWDVETILQQIEGGNITFYDLSPAKASVLINRIKYLPIRISWRQNALS